MSEKPFWEGKTCKEMAGLHVKVTYENGDVLTGVTDEDGDIEYAYTLSDGSVDDKFIPRDFIESIELVDDPECERIDDIGDVRVGDVYVATDGNEYTVTALNKATADPPLRVAVSDGVCWPRRDYFAYALRPAPKLPDKPGLWVTFSPACRGGGFLLKNPSGFSIDRLSPHALWFARFTSRATR